MSETNPTRRDVIKTVVIAGACGAAGNAIGQVSSQPATVHSTKPVPSTAPTADAITVADVAAADRVSGRDSDNDTDRALMLPDLETNRKRLRAYRSTPLDPRIEPAVHFDPRIPGTRVPTGASSCVLSEAPLLKFDGEMESLAFASVADLSRLIKARAITSTQLTKMYLSRLKKYGPRLLCVVNLTEELALKQAARADEEIASGDYRGPLHGIPYGAKDLLATKGIPTTWGISPMKDNVFDYDATVIEKLEAAGAVLVAKLSLGELAMGDIWFGGKTRTPWNSKDGSSGSSAGPGAATAAGLVAFSIGSETLGSIVSPCVVNGTTGLRPTWGRVSRFGAMPLTWTMDKLGPMCRGVEDCALVLHAIHGADPKDPTAADVPFSWNPALDIKSLRVGYDANAFNWSDAKQWKDESIKRIYQNAFDQVRAFVGEMSPIKLPSPDRYSGMAMAIIGVESASSMAELVMSGCIRELVQQHGDAWPNTFRVGSTVPAADYLRLMRLRTVLMQEMQSALKDVDLFVTHPFAGPTLAFTNLTGHPALITRCGMHDGRPKMIEFIGQLYREDVIARVAHAYERATSWHVHRPDVDQLPETPPN